MLAVEGRFDSRRWRHQGLKLVGGDAVWRPGRLAGGVRIAGRRKGGPVADHRFESACCAAVKLLGAEKTSNRYGTSVKCAVPSGNLIGGKGGEGNTLNTRYAL